MERFSHKKTRDLRTRTVLQALRKTYACIGAFHRDPKVTSLPRLAN
jgi:hypothetical protein